MIYLICGNDSLKARHKYDSLIESLLARKKDAVAWKLDAENFDEARFRELIVAQDLFASKYVVGCDHLLSGAAGEVVLENLAAVENSPNIFIILEDKLEGQTLAAVRKAAEKDLSFDKKLEEPKKFNVFALTDALGGRDRKKLWMLYQEALSAGVDVEDIFWREWWMIKNLLFFKKAKDPARSELKGYAKTKIQSYAKNFDLAALERLSRDFVELFFAVRRGETDLETGIERLFFTI